MLLSVATALARAAVAAISEILKAETGVFRPPPEMCGNGLRRRRTGRERERERGRASESGNNMEGETLGETEKEVLLGWDAGRGSESDDDDDWRWRNRIKKSAKEGIAEGGARFNGITERPLNSCY